ncbi:type II toxin-antitoxin system PemK/MazF family toxin [Treponema succinifaciens]|uniref:type II toxin-antitoxin system PemK/MazF family toxin n=1 Tax=Treponema succinifaciens TaxID=167 RepID=UPI0025D7DA1E|nr:type II toxin-antitoxin system PemK/MazF family toxin [Treponema succinifaciens]MDO5774523.1 type II toxin-antitoxin system PemK/MazF family toxin [Spirochaetales bacterium]MDY2615958.1 type II toxin-antitoxin system PemK/MazF family toxin [Treponema succinifaciens]MEE0352283.1 type II toxin-antitoxin system PemK/MazF family toxin [Treponema sp.]
MGMVINQYDVYLVNLDPTVGHEIKKTRPCLVISPDEMNNNISTVIIAPMTTKSHSYPTRIPVKFEGKNGWIVLDQIRTVDNIRLVKRLGQISKKEILAVKKILKEMLVD